MKRCFLFISGLLLAALLYGQENKWLLDKPGAWRFENYLTDKSYKLQNATLSAADNAAFKSNMAVLAEWFRQNHPMLKKPTGYDMRAIANWIWSDYTTRSEAEYGIPATLDFLFEIFDSEGGKWTIEPPQYDIYVNSITGGIEGMYFTPESIVEDGSRYDLSMSEDVRNALERLRQYFVVAWFKESPCSGVDIYTLNNGTMEKVVVYNPERPPYWIPVTLQELADASLAYYTLFQKVEIDRMVLDQLKSEIAELSPEELAAPAYFGHESHFVLRANGSGQGLQIMRFNPEYWDRSLPTSAIQFMSFWNPLLSDEE
ncbi:hypothetical protein EG832_07835, partial [bacterium]|nr:hypothetical protein [bacterium]